MARPPQTDIRMRLLVRNPVPGVAYSLQDKKSQPVDAQVSTGRTLTFEFTARFSTGPRFYGAQVRSEGEQRQFVYIAVGAQAGDAASCWSRRMKIDIHTIPAATLAKAAAGKILEAVIKGAGADGTPACATVTPAMTWRATQAT